MEKLTEISDDFWENEINEFNHDITEEFLQQAHLSPKTLEQYKSALRHFFKFVYDKCRNKPLYELKPRDALKYQNFLINRGLSSHSVKFKRSAVSSLCGYLETYYLDEYPLFRNIYNKKIPNPAKSFKHKKEPLNGGEIELLVRELTDKKEWQMIAYLLYTYITGCRREESRQLLRETITYNKVKGKNYFLTHEIRCKGRGQEGKKRKFAFDDLAMNALIKWSNERGKDDCPYMFVSKNKKGEVRQISPSTFNYWCSKIFGDIIGRRVHPHLLRISRATNLALDSNKSIDAIQSLLGHESPDTTKIYIVKDSDDDLDEIF